MRQTVVKNIPAILIVLFAFTTSVAFVRTHHPPGRIDPLAAQTMDMSTISVPRGPITVVADRVRLKSLPVTQTRPGVVVADNTEIIAARTPGRIVALPVYPGDVVMPGEVVVRLDDAELASRVDEQRAALILAEQNADVASGAIVAAKIALSDADAKVQMARNAAIEARASADAAELDVDNAKTEQSVNAQTLTLAQRSFDQHHASTNSMRVMTAQERTRAQASSDEGEVKITQSEDLRTAALARAVEAEWAAKSALNSRQIAANTFLVTQHQSVAAQAAVDEAKAQLNITEVIDGYATIASLLGGTVTDREVSVGSYVESGATLMRIQSCDHVRLQGQYPTVDLNGVTVGSRLCITLPDGRSINAPVTAMYPSTDPQSHTATVEARLDNRRYKLLPGTLLSMTLLANPGPPMPSVPTVAVVEHTGSPGVWTTGAVVPVPARYRCPRCGMVYDRGVALRDGGRCPMDGGALAAMDGSPNPGVLAVRFIPVSPVRSANGWTEIGSAQLAAGCLVVTDGADGLSDGDAVRIEGGKS